MSFDFGEKPESDPTADFLARERAAAGTLHDDADLFGGSAANGSAGAGNSLSALQGQTSTTGDRDFEHSASNFPALDGDEGGFGIGSISQTTPAAAAPASASVMDDDLLGGGGSSVAAAAPPVDAERDQFERNFPELDEPEPEPMNGFMAPPVASDMGRQEAPAATSTDRQQQQQQQSFGVSSDPYGVNANDEEESEPVRRWREEQEEDIARREATAERRKGETISKAEQDIDNFYAEYNKKKEKNIAQNKEAEAQFKAQRQAELAEGTTWSRVTKLLDLQNSQSKTIARSGPGSTDLTRMKEILLSLRREGETAPGASGY